MDELPSFLGRMVSKRRTWYPRIGRSDSLFASPGPVERLHAEILKLGMCATSLSSGGDNPDLLLFFLVNATPGEDDESLK